MKIATMYKVNFSINGIHMSVKSTHMQKREESKIIVYCSWITHKLMDHL
jgi:hypothetical protein